MFFPPATTLVFDASLCALPTIFVPLRYVNASMYSKKIKSQVESLDVAASIRWFFLN